MTKQEYTTDRAKWINQALSIDKTFFPRCVKARLRVIAKLDAEHDDTNWEEIYKDLLQQFELKDKR